MLVVILIVLMTGIGGITRLTESGLSITEWKPIMGALPPLNQTQWQEAFSKYQQIPQFERIHSTMTLEGFKWIFFWEYLHRLLGRLIGLTYALPLTWYLYKKRIPQGLRGHAIAGLFLGGMQGFVGWIMVKSGLTELTYVSHFRLAAHLLLAFCIAAYLLWIRERLAPPRGPLSPAALAVARWTPWIAALVGIQTLYGALTAGLKAGFMYPTFPTLGGQWLHPDLVRPGLGALNWLSNPTAVQAIHRVLGTVLVVSLMTLWIRSRADLRGAPQYRALTACAHLSVTQYAVGIAVVLLGVPVWAGTLHQVIGCVLFLLTAQMVYVFNGHRPVSPAL